MKRIIISLAVVLLLFLGFSFSYFKNFEPKRILDRLNINRNDLNIEVKNANKDSLKLYFNMTGNTLQEVDTILIYDGKLRHEIPDLYGKNKFELKYRNLVYRGMGLWKKKEWYKHTYNLYIEEKDSLLIIDWSINNAYENYKSKDTLIIK